MPYMSSLERLAYEEGLREGLLESIAVDFKERFGRSGLKLLESMREVNSLPKLRNVVRVVKRAKTLDDIRNRLG